jgi:hypothetical protein
MGEFGGDFQERECAAHIAVGGLRHRDERGIVDAQVERAESALGIRERATQGFDDRIRGHRIEHVHAATRSSAEFNSNDGFSVVAPTNTITPRSMYGRKASCCTLLKRCTSSTNSTVRVPCVQRASASASALRTSGKPDMTAEIAWNSASAYRASSSASVVLPQPGGPHRIIECTWPASIARRSGVFASTRRGCPTTSPSVRGRMRSARGFKPSGSANNPLGVGEVFVRAMRG